MNSKLNRRLSRNEIALYEDALAIIADIKKRQRIERRRSAAVTQYLDSRMDQLQSILGEARNGSEYPTDQQSYRPADYD